MTNKTPKSICILRLSAIGDVTHMVPVVRSIQKYWPNTEITWIIGKKEATLVQDIGNIEFIQFDKSKALESYKNIATVLRHRKFDALICAQVSLRANTISTFIPATAKLGYDSQRSKDLHSLFINQRIPATPGQHVLDSFFSFIEHLGLPDRTMRYDYVIPNSAFVFAEQHLDRDKFKLIISPCSSHVLRNWSAKRYAAVADYAVKTLNAQIILCGGPSVLEKQMGAEIEQFMQHDALNLIGKDTLKKFLALLQGADLLLSPDSGPAHMATGVGTAVIGLYAASNPKRSGPYLSQQWCVNKYNEAAIRYKNKPASKLKWGTKLEYPGVMDLIEINDVTQKLDEFINKKI